MEQKHQKICLVTLFNHEAFFIPLSHIRKIILEISPQSKSIITVSSELEDKIVFDVEKDAVIIYKSQINPLLNVINYFILNLKISWSIFLISKDVDSFLFFMETGFPLPMTIAKLRNKRIIWLLPSSFRKMIEHHHYFPNMILIPLQSLSYNIADSIVLYSQNLIKEWKLQNYSNKIFIARHHFINIDTFTATLPLFNRPILVGYIGRLSEEKGVQNFVRALPAMLNKRKDISVFIGGDGPLKDEIEAFLQAEKLTNCVNLIGWITHDDLPDHLNKLRLLVIPSFSEGLPNIILEAITCGTPVLATSVGAIPEIIKDAETGFIMENNSPGCISENIIRALENPNLEKIAMNAKKMVKKEFTFDCRVKQWERILDEHNS
jgi:glycosyltransferase involved in cell wall biosynthesis